IAEADAFEEIEKIAFPVVFGTIQVAPIGVEEGKRYDAKARIRIPRRRFASVAEDQFPKRVITGAIRWDERVAQRREGLHIGNAGPPRGIGIEPFAGRSLLAAGGA